MQGIVDRIWRNERADGSEYWVLSIGGKRYSTWDQRLIDSIREGDSVEFAFTSSGRFRTITALQRSAGPSFATADKLAPSPESLRITRMSCLRTAAEMLKDTTLLPEQKLSLAITMAERMEEHVLRQPEHTSSAPRQPDEDGQAGQKDKTEGGE